MNSNKFIETYYSLENKENYLKIIKNECNIFFDILNCFESNKF
jgi:hypothetical protein